MIRSRDVIRKGNEHDQTNPVDSPKRLLIKITFKIIELMGFLTLPLKRQKKAQLLFKKKKAQLLTLNWHLTLL